MPPKKRSRKKKAQNAKKNEPDGKNSPAEESAPVLQIAEFPVDYSQSIMDGVTWDTLGGIPCFTCGNVKRCGVRQPISPVTCSAINSWLDYESLPTQERQLTPPNFWAEKPVGKRNLKLEGTKA
jgi:hypothetical protein